LCIACWTGLAQQPSVPDAVQSAFGTPIASATAGSTIARNRAATPVEERVRTRIHELMSARRNRLGPTPPAMATGPSPRPLKVPADAEIHWRDNGLPRHLASTNLLTTSPRPAQPSALPHPSRRVIAFVEEYMDLFRLSNPGEELELVREQSDDLGFTHLRFQQRHQGLRVLGCELLAHIDINGRLTGIESTLESTPQLESLVPAIAAEQAATLTRVRFPGAAAATTTRRNSPWLRLRTGRPDCPGPSRSRSVLPRRGGWSSMLRRDNCSPASRASARPTSPGAALTFSAPAET